MESQRSFCVVIFACGVPHDIACLASRILREVPRARVCGILYLRHPVNGLEGAGSVHTGHKLPGEATESSNQRFPRWLSSKLRKGGIALLQVAHACPANPNGTERFGLEDLSRQCAGWNCSLLATESTGSTRAVEFVRKLNPDLGIILGDTKPWVELAEIPRMGSINACTFEGADGGREVGLDARKCHESSDQVRVRLHGWAAGRRFLLPYYESTFSFGPDDTLLTFGLKRDLVEADLIVQALGDLSNGSEFVHCRSCPELIRDAGSYAMEISHTSRALKLEASPPLRDRPVWKLMLRTLVGAIWVVPRNWIRRFRGRFPVVILFFHLVSDRPHHLGISTAEFLNRVDYLRKFYRIVSLSEAIKLLENGKVERPTIVLTFDDGYAENFINLRAVAEEARVPVTLFVSTGNISTQSPFQHDLKRGQSGFGPLTWEQVISLSRSGFEIGSHTRSHFDCGTSDKAALEREIVGSKHDLEERLGCTVDFFSFPWGRPQNMSPEAIELARRTYTCILSANGGVNFPSSREKAWHLRRCGNPRSLWELELTCQSILDL